MAKLWIAGLGPGAPEALTQETVEAIQRANQVILRTENHPSVAGLASMGVAYVSCDPIYQREESFGEIYEKIADWVLAETEKHGSLCYCVPGHPLVAEDSVRRILEKADRRMTGANHCPEALEIKILPALSFLDAAFVTLGIDPVQERLTILDGAAFSGGAPGFTPPLPNTSCLFAQVYHPLIAGDLKLALLEEAPPDAEVVILYHVGTDEEQRIVCPLAELDHFHQFDHLTSVYLPVYTGDQKPNRITTRPDRYPLDELVGVFRRLLGPGGCPWDQKQSHESLKPYLLEEAGEVLEAIDEKNSGHLIEELGDVLMQIVSHCALAEGRGDFDMNDVITGITEKMIRRHPHVFGEAKADNPEDVEKLWKKIKAKERSAEKNKKKP